MIKLFLPVFDYFKTRRCVILKFIWPTIAAAVYLLIVAFIPVQEGGSLRQFFTDFISSQISIVAIFISFSIAIISILVSADNDNIKRLKSIISSSIIVRYILYHPYITCFIRDGCTDVLNVLEKITMKAVI